MRLGGWRSGVWCGLAAAGLAGVAASVGGCSPDGGAPVVPPPVNSFVADDNPYLLPWNVAQGDTVVIARCLRQWTYAKQVRGSWEESRIHVRLNVSRVERGKWTTRELSFNYTDSWPTPESGVCIEKAPLPYGPGMVVAVALDTKAIPARIVGHEVVADPMGGFPGRPLTVEAKRWKEGLLADIKRFRLALEYVPTPEQAAGKIVPHANICLMVTPSPEALRDGAVRITEDDARKLIDRLASGGLLDRLHDANYLQIPVPKGPTFTLRVAANLYLDMGLDPAMVADLRGLSWALRDSLGGEGLRKLVYQLDKDVKP